MKKKKDSKLYYKPEDIESHNCRDNLSICCLLTYTNKAILICDVCMKLFSDDCVDVFDL